MPIRQFQIWTCDICEVQEVEVKAQVTFVPGWMTFHSAKPKDSPLPPPQKIICPMCVRQLAPMFKNFTDNEGKTGSLA